MRTKEKSTTVYFVRHGQADYPIDRIYCDDQDDPMLSSVGELQARRVAKSFQNIAVDALYTSSTNRTRMTASAISEVLNITPVVNKQLQERRFGIWEGKYFSEIEQQYPDAYEQWKADKVHYTPEGGETILDLQARVTGCLQALIDVKIGKTLVIVAHVGPIRMWVSAAFDIPLHQYRQLNVDYASITRIDYSKTANNLMFLNRIE